MNTHTYSVVNLTPPLNPLENTPLPRPPASDEYLLCSELDSTLESIGKHTFTPTTC